MAKLSGWQCPSRVGSQAPSFSLATSVFFEIVHFSRTFVDLSSKGAVYFFLDMSLLDCSGLHSV